MLHTLRKFFQSAVIRPTKLHTYCKYFYRTRRTLYRAQVFESINQSMNQFINQSFSAIRHIQAVFNRKSYAIFRRVLGYIRQCRSTPLFIRSYVHPSLLFVTLDALMNVKTLFIFCISMKNSFWRDF